MIKTQEVALRAYRADPTDRKFRHVYDIYKPWLRATGISHVRKIPPLNPGKDLDDVVVEGALAMSRAARRFVWFCRTCGEAFFRYGRLCDHAREVHRIRGNAGLVELATFCECSARMAMGRTARRLVRPLEVYAEAPEEAAGGEDVILTEYLIRAASLRMSASAREVLARVLGEPAPRPVSAAVADELRWAFRDLSSAHFG